MKIEKIYNIFINQNQCLSTDTRTIKKGDIFFAIKGDNFDGNKFVNTAFRNGASFCIIDDDSFNISEKCILVDDVLKILQKLSNLHRNKMNAKVLSITGSNGKTTTKELVSSILSSEKKVISTKGNLNNHIGVPLTLLRIKEDTEIAVIEMGANHVGEIKMLCEIANPDFGIVTNIGKAHVGLFGGFDGVVKAKTEMYEFLNKKGGAVFVNENDNILKKQLERFNRLKVIFYNIDDFTISQKNLNLDFQFENNIVKTNLTGEYNLFNISVAFKVGNYFGINKESMIKSVENYKPDNFRSEIYKEENRVIIKDYYNSNPSSLKYALDSFCNQESDFEKIVIIGDIFELGKYSKQEHQNIADDLGKRKIDKIFLVGESFYNTKVNSSKFIKFKTTENAVLFFKNNKPKNVFVLIKASRGMVFERVFDVLK